MSDKQFVSFVCEQLSQAGRVRFRPMMGEYCIYLDDKLIGLVCDNTFYLKMTQANAEVMGNCPTGYPYEGAKPAYVPDVDDIQFLCKAARVTCDSLPAPKKK